MSDVEKQYTKWIYPVPLEDMRAAIAEGSYWEIGDPILYHPLFWPHMRGREKLDILIAGCGSVQAAYYACRNPNWNVIGVDLSESSLAHQQKLKERHGLTNLRLEKLDLTKVRTLGERFDFIVSTGVLHHLPDPDEGLAALRDVLRPEGVINLMVYGKSLRLGVYMLQEVFRLLDFEQTQEDVDIVKATVRDLAPDHVLQRYIRNTNDLHYDAAYVDTFLHPQDRAYYAEEIFEFTRKAGLEFLTWCDPFDYSLEAMVPADHPLWKKLGHLTPEKEAQICDLLTQLRGTHRWAAAHPEYVKKIRLAFETDDFFDCIVIPHRLTRFSQSSDEEHKNNTLIKRGSISYEAPSIVGEIIIRTEGQKNIRQAVLEMSQSSEEDMNLLSLAREEFMRLRRMGHVHILLPEQK